MFKPNFHISLYWFGKKFFNNGHVMLNSISSVAFMKFHILVIWQDKRHFALFSFYVENKYEIYALQYIDNISIYSPSSEY